MREIIAKELEAESGAMFGGEIKVDESCFGGRAAALNISLFTHYWIENFWNQAKRRMRKFNGIPKEHS